MRREEGVEGGEPLLSIVVGMEEGYAALDTGAGRLWQAYGCVNVLSG
jgi:hypothetical protein